MEPARNAHTEPIERESGEDASVAKDAASGLSTRPGGLSKTQTAPRSAEVLHLSEIVVEGHQWPLVPDGQYQAVLIGHECTAVRQFANAAKLFLKLRLHEAGEHTGQVLYRAYRVKWIKDRRFGVARRGDLHKMMCRVLDVPEHRWRLDRLSLRHLRHMILRVNTRTVSKDYKGRPLPECMRYSVIDEIRGVECG